MNSLCVPIFESTDESSNAQSVNATNKNQKPRIKGGIFAREPFFNDLNQLTNLPPLCSEEIPELQKSNNKKGNDRKIPTLVIYGDHDWLSYPEVESDIAYVREKFGLPIQLRVVKNAGHHLYVENPKGFYEAIANWKKGL